MKRWKKDIFARLFWSNKWLMAAGILLSYIQTQVLVTGNKKLSGAIDLMLEGNGSAGMDAAFIGWLVLLAAFGFAAAYGANQCAAYFAVRMQAQFRELAGKKIPWLEYAYFDGNDSASVMNRLVSDTGVVSLYYSEVLPAVVGTVITTVIILESMWKMDWKLVLYFLLVFPPVLLLSDYAGRRIAGLQKKHLQLWDEVNEIAYDNVQGIVVGRSYGLYPLMKKRVEDANRRILKFEFQRNRLSAIPWSLYHVVQWLPNLLFGIMTLYRVVAGELSVGTMTYFILMMDRVVHPLGELPQLLLEVKNARLSKQRLSELMEQPGEWGGEQSAQTVGNGNPSAGKGESGDLSAGNMPDDGISVEFEHVVFGYAGSGRVLDGVDFRIRKGEKAAFVGESGEGKSTVFKLLCGFYRQQEGTVRLFGRTLEQWGIEEARKCIAIVSQNVFLFPETIAWNIACGKAGCGREEIEEACKKANIHEFILSLPEGYATMAGERGDSFSGGQKQRISIARAFLKNAPVLLLDEPTSAVDVETERLIKEAVDRISTGRTVITIAHRLSTIEDADRIHVLSGGRIAEAGTQEDLLAARGIYYRLYERQREGGVPK